MDAKLGQAPPLADHPPYPEASAARSRGLSTRRKWLFRLITVFLAPAVFVLLLEASLRLAGYGYSTSFFQKLDGLNAYTNNPKFAQRFFGISVLPQPALFRLPTDKSADTYRVFVFGSSAAEGFPDHAFSFPRFLAVMLRETYPGFKFEVINTAMPAVNSHVVLPIARECAGHQPDLFIVYMGNNEVIGPYGPAAVWAPFPPSLELIRANLLARTTRIGQLLSSLLPQGGSGVRDWSGMETFVGQKIAADDPRLERMYAYYRQNLLDITRAGTDAGSKAIICTMVTNLKDRPPFASMHRSGLGEEPKAKWEEAYRAGVALEMEGKYAQAVPLYLAASKIDDRFADLRFRLGRCSLGLARTEEAKREFTAARDLDALRYRTDTRINEAIREVGTNRESEGVWLVDAERAFERNPVEPEGIPGEEFLYEHVHFNPRGNYELAKVIFSRVSEILPSAIRSRAVADKTPAFELCAERLAVTAWHRWHDEDSILSGMMARPPFTAQLDYLQRRQQLLKKAHQMQLALSPAAMAESLAACRRAIAANSDDFLLRQNYAEILGATGAYAEQQRQYEWIIAQLPGMNHLRIKLLAPLMAQGKFNEADSQFEQGVRVNPDPLRYFSCAEVYRRFGKVDNAVGCYAAALRLAPNSVRARYSMAYLLAQQSKFGEAFAVLNQALALAPDSGDVEHALGVVYQQSGASDQAVGHLSRAATLDPYSSEIREDLAIALATTGNAAKALGCMADAVRFDPFDPQIHWHYARFLHLNGRFSDAVMEYREAMQLAPAPVTLCNNLAWLLATCPVDTVRNGSEAVQLAEEANRVAGGGVAGSWDVLAAAYAAAGRYDDAARVAAAATDSVAGSASPGLAVEAQGRLELYRSRQLFVTPLPYLPSTLERRMYEQMRIAAAQN